MTISSLVVNGDIDRLKTVLNERRRGFIIEMTDIKNIFIVEYYVFAKQSMFLSVFY